jgi:uncharacterized protein YqjF (DUF2071 family)
VPAGRDTVASPERRNFLTAEWRDLLLLNYAADQASLRPYVPFGTELDEWHGTTYLSVVGFRFLNTRVLGLSIPGHRSFCEVNFRFYVRRHTSSGWRRGVVFLKEIVPRRAVVAIARVLYGEPYVYRAMSHEGTLAGSRTAVGSTLKYCWRSGNSWNRVAGTVAAEPRPLEPDSEAEFITARHWGYTTRRAGRTDEYPVTHPPWPVSAVEEAELVCDVSRTWGNPFADALSASPRSAFAAAGSPVTVGFGIRVT